MATRDHHENFPRPSSPHVGHVPRRGFINPIDDFQRPDTPSNPELFNELATNFKHYNYDLKKLIRWIAHSNAYNSANSANSTKKTAGT